jgi:hypothetical protein
MNGKHLTLLATAVLMLAACSEDISEFGQKGGAADPLADYDGPLSVSISFGGSTTRTSTVLTGEDTDPYVGKHPFPVTTFNAMDTVGIVQVATNSKGVSEVFNFMAVTADGGSHWTVKDVNGQDASVRHFLGRENTYFAYAPFVKGGLVDNTDFLTSSLPTADMVQYDEYCDPKGTEKVPTPACKFFEPLIDRVLTEHQDQSTAAAFNACDVIGARGECNINETDRTAALHFSMNHLLALDILALKKWDGRLTIYGTYDTWVAPDKTIWRMKQQMKPTVVATSVTEPMFPQVDAVEEGTKPLVDLEGNAMGGYAPQFEGLGKWYHDPAVGADTCKFFMQLVKCCVPRNKYGYANSASAGGWIVDIPPVPAGHYVVVGNPYFRFFRDKSTTPSEDNIAGTTWKKTWKEYYQNRPYTWTYEDILFPNVSELYDYDEILEVGDQLMADGNIKKASEGTQGVGTVKWIAYAPAPWLETTAYDNWQRSRFVQNYLLYARTINPRQPNNKELIVPEAFNDNGYRPYGMVTETNGVKHLTIDYAANGCSSLDHFWRTDVCNHFMAFSNSDVTYKSNTEDIKHNDPIFSLAIPSIAQNANGAGIWKYAHGGTREIQGYYPTTWVYFNPQWYVNASDANGVRSNAPASSFGGPGALGASEWMVPTVAQYYMANYSEDNESVTKNLLTCNYLPGTDGRDNEGMVVLNGNYYFNSGDNNEKPVYMGNGYIYFHSGSSESFNSFNTPLVDEWKYATLPIAGVQEASGTKLLPGDVVSTGTRQIEKDKLYIYHSGGAPDVDVPTDYTPCIIY